MKTLLLYVDKWFITGAINIDGMDKPLMLPNGEKRIWLFFHEDIANHRIEYGKSFERDYRDKKPHYFGDIFSLIDSEGKYFIRDEKNPEKMRGIFKASKIFRHFHQAIEDDGLVNTYISFSTDISIVARYLFIEELKNNEFDVKESVAEISYLALEESKKRGDFTDDGNYLALVATNDNLHYSLYKHCDNSFLPKGCSTLNGYGLDFRRRTLVEKVVEIVNNTTRFLSNTEEISQEYIRQDRFVDEWLAKIDNSNNKNNPVNISGITFAKAPQNQFSVTIIPKELDNWTDFNVGNIVNKIVEFVRENNI
ncbi:MAG: hypothetical protein LUC88_03515 [Prevotella sp.]|nr:hypothetical protein [Prevotella sp.]